MGKVSVAEIKELMKSTGVGMMDCKKALEANDGDMDKAIEFLREKGLATQAKKSGRAAAEGVVTAVVNGNVGVLLEVNTETDFLTLRLSRLKLSAAAQIQSARSSQNSLA